MPPNRPARVPDDARPRLPSQVGSGPLFEQPSDSPLAKNEADSGVTNPQITLSTTVQHRGRLITIMARNLTADQFCDLLDRRGFAAPAPQQWQTLPDGTPLCPKHNTPMRLREKQGDSWHSHRVYGPDGEELWCKGFRGKDSPGYEF